MNPLRRIFAADTVLDDRERLAEQLAAVRRENDRLRAAHRSAERQLAEVEQQCHADRLAVDGYRRTLAELNNYVASLEAALRARTGSCADPAHHRLAEQHAEAVAALAATEPDDRARFWRNRYAAALDELDRLTAQHRQPTAKEQPA